MSGGVNGGNGCPSYFSHEVALVVERGEQNAIRVSIWSVVILSCYSSRRICDVTWNLVFVLMRCVVLLFLVRSFFVIKVFPLCTSCPKYLPVLTNVFLSSCIVIPFTFLYSIVSQNSSRFSIWFSNVVAASASACLKPTNEKSKNSL
jgi:hypothetical protein